ncbi:Hypothetical predicted protein [Olea europaea subsp. europaea]|uniref:Uncharacterized protein n=1 Tax=Olea europaea subsp. europaea TaxID=158383 RepID=A0A8S0REH3_OLEEU|nr:Hypothetical predicted protein [Olea europaea subsp. europaea]
MASDQPLKMIGQLLLLSVPVLSFIFSYSLWCSSLVYSSKVYFTAYPIQLVTHALNKNCIFLLCNGLLVFLAKTSGLVHSRAGFDLNDLLQKKIGDGLQTLSLDHEKESSSLETVPTAMEALGQSDNCEGESKEEDCKEFEESKSEPEEEEEEILNLNAEQDYTKEEGTLDLIAFEEQDYKEEEEEDDDDDAECESTEEMNKKFEDFIRRMKEEITTTA